MITIINYGEYILADIKSDSIEDWNYAQATNIKVNLPVNTMNLVNMQRNGYLFVDRTYDVSINLVRSQIDFDKLIRLKVVKENRVSAQVREIALKSFPNDRRFHFSPVCNNNIACQVIDDWLEKLEDIYVCYYRELPIGFASLQYKDDKHMFVHLAAVDENYRRTGAALTLYSYLAKLCKENNCLTMEGTISSFNIPVLNLYSYLGASFSNPRDIFLKEVMNEK